MTRSARDDTELSPPLQLFSSRGWLCCKFQIIYTNERETKWERIPNNARFMVDLIHKVLDVALVIAIGGLIS